MKASRLTKEIIESICEQLLKAEVMKECTYEVLLEFKQPETQWKQKAEMQEETIKKINLISAVWRLVCYQHRCVW